MFNSFFLISSDLKYIFTIPNVIIIVKIIYIISAGSICCKYNPHIDPISIAGIKINTISYLIRGLSVYLFLSLILTNVFANDPPKIII